MRKKSESKTNRTYSMTQSNGERKKATAIIINDAKAHLALLSMLMHKNNFEILTFKNAEQALSEMVRHPLPDIIITGLCMPGIDGWKLCRLMRSPEYQEFNSTPILVISGIFSGEDTEQITSDIGANAFLPLPVDETTFLKTVNALISGQNATKKSRVLIVEDSRALATLLKSAFNRNGYLADTALTAEMAMDALKKNRYSIAVFDYHLPDGNGDQLLTYFKKKLPECVCIMMTADSSPEFAMKWMKDGAAAYVRKPFKPEYLLEMCAKACRERSLLRVEEMLTERTLQLRKEEERYRIMAEKREALIKQRSEERRLLLDTIPTQVWYLSDIETYGPVNQAHAAFLGFHPRKIAYRKLTLFLNIQESRTSMESNRIVFNSGKTFHSEECLTNAQGEKRLISIIKTPKLDYRGDVEFVVCSGTDITDQKKAMEERLEFEKNTLHMEKTESLNQMAGAVAHNFNNLLGVVMGHLELAMEEMTLPRHIMENLNASMKAAQKSAEISRLMLIYLGQAVGRKKEMDLVDFCQNHQSVINANLPKNIALETDFPCIAVPVNADKNQLLMATMNLVTNAWESMEGVTGILKVSVGIVEGRKNSMKLLYPPDWIPHCDQYAYIEIKDSGCGVKEKALNRIFDPFFSTKFTGRGVGLSVVAGIARAHQGAVSVVSCNDNGCTFRIYLPLLAKNKRP